MLIKVFLTKVIKYQRSIFSEGRGNENLHVTKFLQPREFFFKLQTVIFYLIKSAFSPRVY